MAIEKTDAILLRRRNLRESSLILTFCTRDFGKVSGVIKGVRGPRAQVGIKPQLFSLSRIVFYESKKKRLNIVSQCDLLNFFSSIRKDLAKTIYAEYFLELADSLSADFDKNEKLFDLLVDSLELLCTPASVKRIARIFEIRLMDLVGLMPELTACANCGNSAAEASKFSLRSGGVLCGKCLNKDRSAINISRGTVNFIEHVKNSSYKNASRIKVSEKVGKELELILRKFVDYHNQGRLRTVEFMKKIGV